MKKSEKTKMRIKESMLALLTTKELSGITVGDICQQADINRSTFYTHYKDKYHILEAINERICQQVTDHFKHRFHSVKIDSLLLSLVDTINREEFLQMIDIQDGNVNLKMDLQRVVETEVEEYLISIHAEQTFNVSNHFTEKIFAAIAVTFLESAMKEGQTKEKADFLNHINQLFFEYYGLI